MTPEEIVAAVAADHVLTVDDLVGRSHRRDFTDARAEAAFRLWSETGMRLWQIGDVLGGRDHSTISYLVRRHELQAEVR